MKTIETMLNALWTAPLTKIRETALDYGEVAPVGDGDSKTASPGTYRPVDGTCPDCELKDNGCYAKTGNVAIHQRRAPATAAPSVRAAAVAMLWAARTKRLARLHVSGDFLYRGRIDSRYLAGLTLIGQWLRRKMRDPNRINAWTYTHVPRARFASAASMLANAGVAVRYSNDLGPMGAVVYSFDRIDELKAKGVKTFKCLAQLTNKTCAECGACWTLPEHVIVFDPHGPGKNKAASASLRVLQ